MNEIMAVVKLKLEPSIEMARILDGQSRICNWLYNSLLEKANQLREDYRQTQNPVISKTLYTERGLRNLVPSFKKEHCFLKSVYSSPLKNTALRLTDSIQTYQKSRKGKQSKKSGWPKFRSWKARWFSLFYDEPFKGYKIEGKFLRLSLGTGEDRKQKFILFSMPDASILSDKTIRNLRIVKQAGIYSAVFTVVRSLPTPKDIQKVIALDPNHKNLAYGVNTEGQAIEIEAPFFLKSYDKRIDELKSLRDKRKKKSHLVEVLDNNNVPIGKQRWEPSKRWKKMDATLEKVYAKRREQTKTFCYTVANRLFKEHDLVSIGDYTPHGGGCNNLMRRAMNNRSLIGRLKETLSWVAQKSGKWYTEFSEKGTTRTCHECDYSIEGGIPLNIRYWICPNCQAPHIRDENAGKNGLIRVLRNLKEKDGITIPSVPCSGRVSIKKRWAWCVRPSGVHATSRGSNYDSIMSTRKLNEERDSSSSKIGQFV
jgi:putative transposase